MKVQSKWFVSWGLDRERKEKTFLAREKESLLNEMLFAPPQITKNSKCSTELVFVVFFPFFGLCICLLCLIRLFKRWKLLVVFCRHENWILDRSPLIWGPCALQGAQFPTSQPCVLSIRHKCLRTDIAVPWDNCILIELSVVLCKRLCRDGRVRRLINKTISANNCFCIRIKDLTSGRRCP